MIEGDKRGFYKHCRKANKWSLIPYEDRAMWSFAEGKIADDTGLSPQGMACRLQRLWEATDEAADRCMIDI